MIGRELTDEPRQSEEEGSSRSDEGSEFLGLRGKEERWLVSFVRDLIEGERTHDHGSQNENADQKDDSHQDVVQPRNGSVQVSHRGSEREPLTMNLHQAHFDLVSSRSSISISIEYLEGLVGDVEGREVSSDISDLNLLLPLTEGVVDPSGELESGKRNEAREESESVP